jgi:EpsI family protein
MKRFLIANLLLLVTLAIILSFGPLVPGAPAEIESDGFVFTLDRGGLLRFYNGKVNVKTAYDFNLYAGPQQVPHYIGPWEGTDFPLNLEAYTSVEPELLINRAYRNSRGERVAFTVIGSNTSRKLHRPEICYRAADWLVEELPPATIMLDDGKVALKRFIARSDSLHERRLVLYWYLWHDERRRIEDGAYIMQVATSLIGQSDEAAMRALDGFIRQILHRTVDTNPLALRRPSILEIKDWRLGLWQTSP